MKNKSVHSCRFVHHAKFHCIMTTLNKLFKIKFERGGGKLEKSQILLQNERFERFLNGLSKKTARKPRKIWTVLSGLSKKNRSKTAQDLIIKSRPRWDSNPKSSDSKSDALSVSLCGLAGSLIFAVFLLLNMFNVLDIHNKYTVRIFIVSLYKIIKIIDYKIAHQPPPPPTSY